MRISEKGFTLFEVLVSMFVTGVALLGVAQIEVYILKSSQSSFDYTVATIRANSFVDAVWAECYTESASASTYSDIRAAWVTEISAAGMTTYDTEPPAAYNQDMVVKISWTDLRFANDAAANSTLTLSVRFPNDSCGT
ncbi:MAG: type IV pilus assembly protein PilV [Psychromonas sp.]|jgi:type IV pilus assembly protein PilV